MFFCYFCWCFFFKQKTAYEMRISDWSSDVCSSDLADLISLLGLFYFCVVFSKDKRNPVCLPLKLPMTSGIVDPNQIDLKTRRPDKAKASSISETTARPANSCGRRKKMQQHTRDRKSTRMNHSH